MNRDCTRQTFALVICGRWFVQDKFAERSKLISLELAQEELAKPLWPTTHNLGGCPSVEVVRILWASKPVDIRTMVRDHYKVAEVQRDKLGLIVRPDGMVDAFVLALLGADGNALVGEEWKEFFNVRLGFG